MIDGLMAAIGDVFRWDVVERLSAVIAVTALILWHVLAPPTSRGAGPGDD